MAAKAVLGASFGAAAAYGVYQHYKHQQVLQDAEEEQAKREEERLAALQRLQELMQKRSESKGPSSTTGVGRAGAAGTDERNADRARKELLLRLKLFGTHLARLKSRLERGYRKRAAHEVLRVPVLGATEPPTAVLAAVLCLWGDLHLFTKFVIDPYVMHELGELDTETLVEPEEMLQFGFTLMQLSDWTCDTVERWLLEMACCEALEGFGQRLSSEVMSHFLHALAVSNFGSPALFSICQVNLVLQECGYQLTLCQRMAWAALQNAGEAEVEDAKRLASLLGLHVVSTNSLTHEPRPSGLPGITLKPSKPSPKIKKLMARAGYIGSELWLANFPLSKGFDIANATVSPDTKTWSYNLEAGVFYRNMGPFASKPIPVDEKVTKEQWERREDFLVRERLSREATTLLKRLRTEHREDLDGPVGLKVLQGCSLEHCIAISGELDLYSQMLGPVDTNLLNMLREVDLHLVEMQQPKLAQGLGEGLMDAVPPPPGADATAAQKALEAEVSSFVSTFVQMLRAKYWQTPLSRARRAPAEVVPQQCVSAEATSGLYTDSSQTKMLRYKLVCEQQRRDAIADQLATVPLWWCGVLVVVLLLLAACAHQITYAALDRLVMAHVAGAPLGHVLGAQFVQTARWVVGHGLALLLTLASMRPLLTLAGGPRRFAQSSFLLASKQCGLRVPIVRDIHRLEAACKRQLVTWTRRSLAATMAAAVSDGAVQASAATQWLHCLESTVTRDAPHEVALPGTMAEAVAFLRLPLAPEDAPATSNDDGGGDGTASSVGGATAPLSIAAILNASLHTVRHGSTACPPQRYLEAPPPAAAAAASATASTARPAADSAAPDTTEAAAPSGQSEPKQAASSVQRLLESPNRKFVRGKEHMLLVITPTKGAHHRSRRGHPPEETGGSADGHRGVAREPAAAARAAKSAAAKAARRRKPR